jgi:hypothetical protein
MGELVAGVDHQRKADIATPETLRATLHNSIDDHVRFAYTSTATDTWDILDLADEDPADSGRVLTVDL